MQEIDEIFGKGGQLDRALEGYRPRRSQARMAARVAEALAGRSSLIVEAGTGTGKTFAYLVPALLSGPRVIISTGTRTLQDQLYSKDLPLVAGAIGMPARIALLKGRSNYLCVYRLGQAGAQGSFGGELARPRSAMLATIERWARLTERGDLAEVPGLTDADPLWPQVTSTRDNCLGQRCPDYARCHVIAARRQAQEADVVVVNHHLLFADLALKEDGFGDILGTADAIILDEAHQIPDLATQFFGTQLGSRQIENLLADARAALATAGAPITPLAALLREIEGAIGATLAVLPRRAGRVSWDESGAELESFVLALATPLRSLGAALEQTSREAAVVQCAERAAQFAEALEHIALAGAEEGARTVEASGRSFTLGLLPFDISQRFNAIVTQRPAAWIFTSATLTVGSDFSHFAARMGLTAAATEQIPSPFDFETQALLFLPTQMPEPSAPEYLEAVLRVAESLIGASRGGAFLLFTSHRALARAAALARSSWALLAELPLLVQGESPRERLLKDFRELGNAVLFGTSSFWEGVDVKGDALRLVIIEKLPFDSPEDPLVKARIDHLQRSGGNPFRDYQLPEAVLTLKQGFGRLIRSETDRGVIAICDPRLTTRSYGRIFLASLPPITVTRELDEARRFLRRAG